MTHIYRFTPSLVPLYIGALFLLLSGCGKDGAPGQSIVGPMGPPGQQGASGATGPAGQDAYSWTVVQLCSQCTTHYPDTFAEVVFCYAGDLYGTYSANGGFSAKLPPGRYDSNGINCSCTVTIGSGCTVSQ